MMKSSSKSMMVLVREGDVGLGLFKKVDATDGWVAALDLSLSECLFLM